MNFFDNYFVFSTKEKKGILVLCVIIVLMIIAYRLIPHFFKPQIEDFSSIKAEIEAFNKKESSADVAGLFLFNPNTISKDSLLLLGLTPKQAYNIINYRTKVGPFRTKEDLSKIYSIPDSLSKELMPFVAFKEPNKSIFSTEKVSKKERVLFKFNPNTVSKDSLVELGLSKRTAETFIKFRNSTGGFTEKEELKKIYGISDKLYQEIVPFVDIPVREDKNELSQERKQIALNTASKVELMEAKGIGSVFSQRIIDYREKLGGFYEVDQLIEVFGIDQEWLDKFGSQFVVKSSEINQLFINSIEFKELLKHPYFSYSEVQRIINYRDMHGNFVSLEQIRDNNLINAQHYRKIAPYITIN